MIVFELDIPLLTEQGIEFEGMFMTSFKNVREVISTSMNERRVNK